MLGDQQPTPAPANPYFGYDDLIPVPGKNNFYSRSGIADAFNAVADAIGRHMESQGFWDDEDELLTELPKHLADIAVRWKNAEKFMLILTELTEAVESDRKQIVESDHLGGFTMLEEEMADIIIRVLDFCHRRKLRIGEAFVAKLDYNASRPHRHGKQF